MESDGESAPIKVRDFLKLYKLITETDEISKVLSAINEVGLNLRRPGICNWRGNCLGNLLHFSALYGSRKLVVHLLDAGCDPELTCSHAEGNTALHLSAMRINAGNHHPLMQRVEQWVREAGDDTADGGVHSIQNSPVGSSGGGALGCAGDQGLVDDDDEEDEEDGDLYENVSEGSLTQSSYESRRNAWIFKTCRVESGYYEIYNPELLPKYEKPSLEASYGTGAGEDQERGIHNRALPELQHLFDYPGSAAALCAHGADVNRQNLEKQTPLMVASQTNGDHVARLLVSHGADGRIKDRRGYTPLIMAIGTKNPLVIRHVLRSRCDVNSPARIPSSYVESKMKPLEFAIELGNIDGVDALVQAGAEVEFVSEMEVTPLMNAARYNEPKIVECLVRHGCDVNVKESGPPCWTALHFACWNGCGEVCRTLLSAGADHDGLSVRDRHSPLALAALKNHLSIMKMLLLKPCAVNSRDYGGDTPMHSCAWNGEMEGMRMLLDEGADVTISNYYDTVPLWNSVYKFPEHHDLDVVLLLLQHSCASFYSIPSVGLDQQVSTHGVTTLYTASRSPLYVALDKRVDPVARMLVLAGVNVSHEEWWQKKDLPKTLASDTETPQWFFRRATNPQSLLRLCRNGIRTHCWELMKTHRVRTSIKLPQYVADFCSDHLPKELNAFVLMKTFSDL